MMAAAEQAWTFPTFNHGVLLLPVFISTILFFVLDCPRKTIKAAFFKVLPVWCLINFVIINQCGYSSKPVSMVTETLLQPSNRPVLFILLGLFFSSIGDICLILADFLVVPGGLAFLVAHRFYFIAIETDGDYSTINLIVFLLLWVSAFLYLQTGKKSVSIFMRIGFGLYLLALFAVGWKSTERLEEFPNMPDAVLCFIGSILFIVSDLIIFITFLKTSLPRARLLYMLTYYFAQFAYALSTVYVNVKHDVTDNIEE